MYENARRFFGSGALFASILYPCQIIHAYAEKTRYRNEFGKRRLALPELPQAHDGFPHIEFLGKLHLPDPPLLPQRAEPFPEFVLHKIIFP